MNLKSFGCSFIFGSELSGSHENKIFSKFVWPVYLARHLGYIYRCYAKPASGNLQILEQVLTQAASSNTNTDLFVIGWTWIDRFDYCPVDPSNPELNSWHTILPGNSTALSKIYYRDLHSEYRDKFTCLSYIKLAIDTLTQKNIPFIMTYMDELLFDQEWHATPAVIDLQKYIKPHMTTFEGKSFLEWSRSKGYPETKSWHPLEEAHRAAGEYIIGQRPIHSA